MARKNAKKECQASLLFALCPGRRVPPLWAGGGLVRITPHCVVVTVSGAELVSFASHTRSGWFIEAGAELRRYGKPHCSLRRGLERAELVSGGQWAEPRALRSAGAHSLKANENAFQMEVERVL